MSIELIAHPTIVERLVQILREAGLTLVGDQARPGDTSQVVLVTSAALWCAATTDHLLSTSAGHEGLIAADPYRTWLARRGGVAAVLAWIEEYVLGQLPPQLQPILRGVLDDEHYLVTTQRTFLSRACYYKARKRMFALVSDYLNAYDDEARA